MHTYQLGGWCLVECSWRRIQEYINSLIHIQTKMQNKSQSRPKLPQYCSLKQFESVQEHSKKPTKHPNTKSSKKIKQNKSAHQSHSKSKLNAKPPKNNENFNSANLPPSDIPKIKTAHHQPQNSKKHIRHDDKLKRNSSEKLLKSKSMLKLQLKTERRAVSPTPIAIRQTQHHREDKPKTSKNVTSRSQKQRKATQRSREEAQGLKKSSSKVAVGNKSEQTQRSNRNRVSIKTEMSSKTHSVIKEEGVKSKKSGKAKPKKVVSKQIKSERNRPYQMPRPGKAEINSIVQRSILYSEVSFQQYNKGENPCESAFVSNDKYFLHYPDLKTVKTEGCQIQHRSHSLMSLARPEEVRAATKIQKVFRGFITRKYIDEAKYIIGKVKVIQKWWRKVANSGKERVNQKIVSSSNSLITIKDFNDTLKTDKHRLFSQSKENTLSNNKLNLKEFMRNILEENQSEKYSNSSEKEHSVDVSRDKNTSRDHYVELKIQDEIKSERKFNFNSPRSLSSPNSARTPTNCMFNMNDLFSNAGGSNQKQKVKQLMHSPRIISPQQLRNTPQQLVSEDSLYKHPVDNTEIEPFETNFTAIQEFGLLTVNYFRDKPHQMKAFIERLETLKQFRTNLILKGWNTHTICYEQLDDLDETLPADYVYLQAFERPMLFDKEVREDIIHFPEIEIDLIAKRFNLQSTVSGPIHRTFLQFVFDALQQALYEQHRSTVLTYGKSLDLHIFRDQQSLFQNYLSSALDELYHWGEVLCGFMAELPAEQEYLREERMKKLVNKVEPWDLGHSHRAAIKIELAEMLLQELLEEAEGELERLQ